MPDRTPSLTAAEENTAPPKEAAALRNIGVTGLKRFAGIVNDEYHPDLRGRRAIKVFREMRDNDAVVGAILYAIDMLIRQSGLTINPVDEHDPHAVMQADHARACFEDMEETEDEFLSDAVSMVWAGFSLHEKVYKVRRGPGAALPHLRSKHNDGLIGIRSLAIRAQDSIDRWEFDRDGRAHTAIQLAWPEYKRVAIPTSKLLHFRTSSNRNNPEGRSLLRNSYRTWWFLKRIEEFEAIGAERDMAGELVARLPYEFLLDSADQDQQDFVEEVRKIVERARRGEESGFVYPSGVSMDGEQVGFDLSLLQAGGRRPMDLDGIIRRKQSRIAISLLGEMILLGMQGNVGSWSLADTKSHLMSLSINALQKAIADVLNRHLFPELALLNGWAPEAAPVASFGDIESPTMLENLPALVQAQLITPDEELEVWLRKRLGVPIREEVSLAQLEDAVLAAPDHVDAVAEAQLTAGGGASAILGS